MLNTFMKYLKTNNPVEQRSSLIGFRASTEERQRAEAIKSLLQLESTSAVFRTLLDEKAAKLGLD